MLKKYKNLYFLGFFIFFGLNINAQKIDTAHKINDTLALKRNSTQTVDSLLLNNDTLTLDSVQKKVLEAQVDYDAEDSVVILVEDQKIFLYKNANVDYTTMKMSAHYLEMDMKESLIIAKGIVDTAGKETGLPVFLDKSDQYESRLIKYNYETKKAYVEDILTEEEGGYVMGEKTKRVGEKTFYLEDGRYTTCDIPDDPHYYIRLRKAKMIKEKAVFARGFGLAFEDAYIAYFPLPIFFPFKKKYSSGFIMPSYGEENRRGFFFRDMGFYWAATDYFDFRFTGDVFTNGSWGVKGSTNYKKRYKFNGVFNVQFYNNKFGDKNLDNYSVSKDFSIRWKHSQDAKAHPYRSFSASVNFSTATNDYNNSRSIADTYGGNSITSNKKQSSIAYSRRWPNSPFNLSMTLRHSQNSRDSTIDLSLPDVNLSMNTIYPFRAKEKAGKLRWYDKISMGYSAQLKNTIHIHEDDLLNSNFQKDWKNGFKHSIPIGGSFKLARDLTFSPNLNYNGVLYTNSIRKSYDNVNSKVVLDTVVGFAYGHNLTASASMSYTPKIYGTFHFNEKSRIKALRHVISPSLSFSYKPELDIGNNKYYKTYSIATTDQEVEYSIFEQSVYGTPSSSMKSGSIGLSIDNNLELKVAKEDSLDLQKIKILESFRLSTSYNLFADSMNLSLIRLSGRTTLLNKKVNLTFGGDLDPYAIDENGRRYNKLNGILGRLTSFNFSLGTQFSAKSKSEKEKPDDVERIGDYMYYTDFDIPWNVRLDYSFRYTKPGLTSTTTQNLRLSGDFNLTPKWKITFNTGYDFDRKEVTATQFGIIRDLHCWEMSFSAIPFGIHQSFNFQINVKSSLLKDLKLDKRDAWQDNF